MADEIEMHSGSSLTDSIAAFQRDGHVLIENIIGLDDLSILRDAVRGTVEASRVRGDSDFSWHPTGIGTTNIWVKSERARRYILSAQFALIAARLLGVNSVRIYHDAALFKQPGGAETGWHQDNSYDVFQRSITLWLPLMDIPEQPGSLQFVSGSHKLGDLESDDTELLMKAARKKYSNVVSYGAMKAGNASFHSGWTIHRALGNSTVLTREVLGIVYYPDGEPLLQKETPRRVENKNRWFPKGESDTRSSLHPVVFTEIGGNH